MRLIHAEIYTMEGDPIPDGFLETEGGKIRAVGPMEQVPFSPEQAVDVNGVRIIPGFIDAHCHVGIFNDGLGFEGDDGNEDTDPITPHLRAIDAVNPFDRCFEEALDAGVTTLLTGPGSTNPIAGEWCALKTLGSSVDEMMIKAPVGMKFALGENPKLSYNSKNQAPNTRMAIAALIREELKKARRYLEDCRRAEEDEELDPPEYDIKCEALVPVVQGDLKAFFHAHRADDIQTAVRIAKEFNLDYVIVHATEGYKIANYLKKEGVRVITGPILCDRSKPELAGQTVSNTSLLQQAGVETAICTDHPENPIQYLPLEAELCIKAGLPHYEALKAVTINAAQIAGIEDRVGSLMPGKDADFLLFDSDPLDIKNSPKAVVINGEVVRGKIEE